MNINFRRVKGTDYNSIKKLLYDNFDVEIKKYFVCKNQYDYVALVDNTVVAYFLLNVIHNPINDFNYCHLDWLCVDFNYRNIGVGTEIINYIVSFSKEKKLKYVELTSSYYRKDAHSLYSHNGFEIRESNIFRRYIK